MNISKLADAVEDVMEQDSKKSRALVVRDLVFWHYHNYQPGERVPLKIVLDSNETIVSVITELNRRNTEKKQERFGRKISQSIDDFVDSQSRKPYRRSQAYLDLGYR